MKSVILFFIAIIFVSCRPERETKHWTIAPFTKIDQSNPVLSPNSETFFIVQSEMIQ